MTSKGGKTNETGNPAATYLLEALYVIVAYNNISRRFKMQSSTLRYTCPFSYKRGQANYTFTSTKEKL